MNIRHLKRNRAGFTLLEIMVSVAILSISLVALMSFQGNTMITSGRAERITEATMLARMRMGEVELDLESKQKKGEFPEEKTEEGDFEDPFGAYRWKLTIKNVTLPAPVQGQEGSVESMVGRQLTEEIAKTVREVRLDIVWEEMGKEQSINVVTHIVKL
jgi:prepilin-type N-terminal cleavage/methylation domain-containing protein